ncbi:high-affinity iron permease [Pleurotus ostreatus]|uniref:High-affinity iron permease n=1 Tax=Pleurotus ostreatus TaxID=5322 RepID=A0A8H7DVB7_PLEOS|nr:high-affinity iron permease [Pleurotus ostreatus]KAF7430457.1 high-affinity iron permease [Pleurotus ostreatus]KAJ8701628.1 high-affinity iron permease [Pleurotus ostreatus]
MAKDLFSVPIFFIVFRETLEAAIIVSVLLGLVEQIVYHIPASERGTAASDDNSSRKSGHGSDGQPQQEALIHEEDSQVAKRRLIRKLRIQIFVGAGLGLFIALAIGAAFIAVWFTQASDLWAKSEELWEGVFELIASLMIFVMGITMLKVDRAKTKWRIKLQRAFDGKQVDGGAKTGKWALFVLPFITVLREGLEAVVFVGGVSLGQSATAIPIAAIVGIICGLVCGFLIYSFASRATLTVFLVVMTNFLLLIGAGLFSKAVGAFETHAFNKLLGADVDDAGGDGPGSFRVQGNVWHLNCCNPDNVIDGHGWLIFNALFGWSNNASLGTVLSYVFYWIAVIAVLIFMKFNEGRTKLMGYESSAGGRRRQLRDGKAAENEKEGTPEGTGVLPH